jgi:serine/threonine protein kinase
MPYSGWCFQWLEGRLSMAICPHCERAGPDVLQACPSDDGYICIDEDDYHQWPDDPLLGREVGERYIVLSVLGRGAMGRVYKAHQKQVDRLVALKVFRPEMLLAGEVGRRTSEAERERAEQRFIREARVLGRLSHPNCVTLYDFGTGPERDFLYMAMEFVAGLSLRQAIQRGLKFEAILSIMLQTADALIAAHAHDVVHRDLKPDNVVLAHQAGDGDPTVKVLDFGIAKLAQGATQSGATDGVFGTPAYMSPEQCRGSAREVGPVSDIYALGCICYEMVCGRLPFESDDPEEMMRKHREAEIPKVDPRAGLDVPDELADIITKALQKHPEDRWRDASACREAIAGVMAQHSEADETGELSIRRVASAFRGGSASQDDEEQRRVQVPDNRVASQEHDPFVEQSFDSEASAWDNDAPPPGTEDFDAADTVIDPEAAERWANMEAQAADTDPTAVGPTPPPDGEQSTPWKDAEPTDPINQIEADREFEGETTQLAGVRVDDTSFWSRVTDRQVVWALALVVVMLVGCVATFVWIYLTMGTG